MSQPQQTLPFPNSYQLKQVAAADAKSCFICYKFTPVVLITTAGGTPDFFYACKTHLSDTNFATIIHNEAHTKNLKQVEYLQGEITKVKGWIAEEEDSKKGSLKDYAWSKLTWSSKPLEEKPASSPESKDAKILKFRQNLGVLEAELKELNDKTLPASQKKNTYLLVAHIYRARLQQRLKKLETKKHYQSLHQEGFFPSAPSNKPV
ncbi:hypothetical protein BABINDRAFT_5863 [Babjeviella inositovora NRRL Y-12698]|uniref:VPS4-associated protein 1 n=1 Tax=Babjeviella inositovora NRRL Y-12698 TaxID=984486 RepID=A0A1E3QZD6_9ASCO|nr:uncharacterized protein BABINDRAFT_5863 [Babjeviella inositovora NRRL Y-12698]ODQ82985.1 hypothetical protein BABINDRAFT_5863 [Babjeviella inositovora NRRL Y-12698]